MTPKMKTALIVGAGFVLDRIVDKVLEAVSTGELDADKLMHAAFVGLVAGVCLWIRRPKESKYE